jgi:hypothetical protein
MDTIEKCCDPSLTIKTLELNNFKINKQNVTVLAKAISLTTSLKILSLHGNCLDYSTMVNGELNIWQKL